MEKTSKAGDAEPKCFIRRSMALPVPRSTSSVHVEGQSHGIAVLREGRCEHTLEEEGQESDHEHEENTNDATVNPAEDRVEVVAARYSDKLPSRSILADCQLVLEGTQEDHYNVVST